MTSTILIAMMCAVIAVVVSFIVNIIMSPDEEKVNERFAKMWNRIQKIDSRINKDTRFWDSEFTRFGQGLTQTRKILSALTGMVSMDYSEKQNHIIAQKVNGDYVLLDLNVDPVAVIPLKKVKKMKKEGDDMITIRFKDMDLEYKKPVNVDF